MSRRVAASALLSFAMLAGVGTVQAEVPQRLLGNWSTDAKSCEDDPAEGITVLALGASEVSWYEFSCRIVRSTRAPGGVALAIDCVKGGAARGTGTIDIVIKDGRTIEARFSQIGKLATPWSTAFRRCVTPAK